MIPEARIEKLLARYAALESALSTAGRIGREELVRLSKEHAELTPSMERIRELQRVRREITELTEIVEDAQDEPEMAALARAERESHERRLPEIEHAVRPALQPTLTDVLIHPNVAGVSFSVASARSTNLTGHVRHRGDAVHGDHWQLLIILVLEHEGAETDIHITRTHVDDSAIVVILHEADRENARALISARNIRIPRIARVV